MFSRSFALHAAALLLVSLLLGLLSMLGLYAVADAGGLGSLTSKGTGVAYSELLTGTVSVSGILGHNLPFLLAPLLIAAIVTRHRSYPKHGHFFVAGEGSNAHVVEERCERVGAVGRALAYISVFGGLVILTTGSTVAAVANGARMTPYEVMTSLVHGPLEFAAFSAPLAALLLCASQARRVHLRHTLVLALSIGVVLLVAGAVVETHVTPSLLRAAFEAAPIAPRS